MAERDSTHGELLFSDVPGDRERVRVILEQWGVDGALIRRLMREHAADPHGGVATRVEGETPPPSHAGY